MASTAHVQPLQVNLASRTRTFPAASMRRTLLVRYASVALAVITAATLFLLHRSEVNAKSLEIAQLQERQDKLNQNLSDKDQQLAAAEKKQADLTRAQENERADWQRRLTQLEQQVSADRDQQRRLQDDTDHLRKDYQTLQTEHNTAVASINDLQQRLATAQDALAKSEHKVNELQGQAAKSATDANAARQQVTGDKAMIDKAENERKDAENKLQRAKSDQEKNEQKDEKLQEQIKKLQNELTAAQNKIRELEKQPANRGAKRYTPQERVP